MRGRSTKHGKELEKSKLKEEPHLSGAYIRSLVKQLTSSKTKDPANPKSPVCEMADGLSPPDATKSREVLSQNQPQQPQPSQPKKQVRRRLHTSRPYQERLLNMAEARREIVTALKFHRAAMKQASEQQQLQLQPPIQAPLYADPVDKLNSSRNPRICPSNFGADATSLEFPNHSYNKYCYPSFPAPFSWTSSPSVPLPVNNNFNLPLPNQLLGLNLNFKDFGNIETSSYHNNDNSSNTTAPSSSSSSSSLSSSSPYSTCAEVSTVAPIVPSLPGGDMHQALDEEEMAELRSIGEQHDMEWNDALNLVTSAWWFKFLKTMESGPESREERRDEYGLSVFDDLMNIPSWLNGGGPARTCDYSWLQQRQLFDNDLPSLDIGEIEGMDGDWLA